LTRAREYRIIPYFLIREEGLYLGFLDYLLQWRLRGRTDILYYPSPPFTEREGRNRFIAEVFRDYFGRRVVNIGGGGDRCLLRYLPESTEYLDVDVYGEPDLRIDLEKDLPIPLEDNSYDTVVCTEVLEHLETIHEVFAELVRISRGYILISLPNNFSVGFKNYLFEKPFSDSLEKRKKYGKYMKFYGLPFEIPPDRHKWFFDYIEAREFMEYKAKKHGVEIVKQFGLDAPSGFQAKLFRLLVETLLGTNTRVRIFCGTYWCALKKSVSQTPG